MDVWDTGIKFVVVGKAAEGLQEGQRADVQIVKVTLAAQVNPFAGSVTLNMSAAEARKVDVGDVVTMTAVRTGPRLSWPVPEPPDPVTKL